MLFPCSSHIFATSGEQLIIFLTSVSGDKLCCTCSPPHPYPSPSFNSGMVRPINHWASAYHLGAPIACQSSDKIDFQLSQGSEAGPGRLENRQTSAAPLPLLLLVIFFFLSPTALGLFSLPHSLLPSLCITDVTWNENRVVVKDQMVMNYH